MNCFCLVASIQTALIQRLIFLSDEVSPGLQTQCPHNDWHVENNCRSPHFTALQEGIATAANSTNYEGHFNGTHYLSCRFKCFAHLFPLNISSSLKYSFNFLFKFFTSLFAVAIFLPPF